jgi:hypothetical protein
MNEHDKHRQGNVSKRRQCCRVGTAVLVAAASLVDASLGVTAATSTEPVRQDANPAGLSAVDIRLGEQENVRLATIKVNVQTPHITVKTNQPKITTPVTFSSGAGAGKSTIQSPGGSSTGGGGGAGKSTIQSGAGGGK